MTIVKSFYDGRGLPDDRLVVLSALVARDSDIWDGFQREWNEQVMPKTGGAPLSVTDCLFRKRFAAIAAAVELVRRWTCNGIHRVFVCGPDGRLPQVSTRDPALRRWLRQRPSV